MTARRRNDRTDDRGKRLDADKAAARQRARDRAADDDLPRKSGAPSTRGGAPS